MNTNEIGYLTEAFKQLELLDEDAFGVDDKSLAELDDFINTPETDESEEVVKVVDPEASEDDELLEPKDYVGKVIVQCCVCHTSIYKPKNEVIIDSETGLANIDEECPFCYTTDGYNVIGEVSEFNPNSTEDDEFTVESDDADVKVEVEKKDDTESEKDKDDDKEKNESLRRHKKMKKLTEAKVTPQAVNAYMYAYGVSKTEATKKVRQMSEDGVKELIKGFNNDAKSDFYEDLNNISLDTQTEHITITSEPKQDEGAEFVSDDTMIVPVTDDVEDDIIDKSEEVAEEENEDDTVDMPIDDFDTDSFDGMEESYLRKNYSNVKSYKTTSVTESGNKLKVEGVVTFKSGKSKKVTSIFEGKLITKTGRIMLEGVRTQSDENGRTVKLIGTLRNNKMVTEKLHTTQCSNQVN